MTELVKRSISGTVFVVLTVACLFNKYAFGVYFALVMVAMLWEFYAMTVGERHMQARLLAIAAAVTAFVLSYMCFAFAMPPKYISLALLPVLLIMISEVFAKDKDGIESVSHIFGGLLYIALPVVFSPVLVFGEGGFCALTLLSFFIIIWCADVGAYCLGTAFGQKPGSLKLCPSISPKKSWIGVGGGLLFAVVAALALHYAGLLDVGLWHSVVLGVILMVGGVFGDLYESLWKRHYGIKDSGNIIPGHGGILDRFDSSLIAIPLAAIYYFLAV